jgi:hypothetical protein
MHIDSQLDMRAIWGAWSRGELSDQEAERLAEAHWRPLHGGRCQTAVGHQNAPTATARPLRAPRRQRTPDRQRSIERRRRLAASGPMPPALAAKFTTGELAVLRIIADEAKAHGGCRRCIDEIAARAGTCRTTAQNAIRAAKRLRLITVQERRVSAFRNDTNVVRIVSREWLAWLTKREGSIFRMARPTGFSGEQRFATSMPTGRTRKAVFDRRPQK